MAWAPLINDVSTDLERPPAFRVARHGELPTNFISVIRQNYGDLESLRVSFDPAQAFEIAEQAATAQPRWRVTVSDPAAGHLEIVATTRLLRFRDDLVVRVTPGSDGGAILDMRSTSRLGKGDFGANAARIRSFFDDLRKRFAQADECG